MRITYAIIVLVLAFSSGASAQTVDTRGACADLYRGIITQPTIGAPPLVNATLTRFPQLAFRLCNDRYFLRAPEQPVDGVCIFNEAEVFSRVNPNVPGTNAFNANTSNLEIHWNSLPGPWSSRRLNATYMVETNGNCPALDAGSYVSVANTSAENFKLLTNFWRTLIASETNFDAAVAQLRNPEQCDIGTSENEAARRQTNTIATLRVALFGQHRSLAMLSVGPRAFQSPGYSIQIEDPTSGHGWSAEITISNPLQLVCLSTLVVT
jgi:hypothetical protein